jgi:hypothetical protein
MSMSMFKRVDGEWVDGLQSGSRRPRLLVAAPDGTVTRFAGESIPGALAVMSERFRKNGKWSSTTYRFALADGAALVECVQGLHQQPFDEYDSWSAVVAGFERVAQRTVDPGSLRAAVEPVYPKSMVRIDEREAALAPVPAPAPEPESAPAPNYADVILTEVTPEMLHTERGAVTVRYTAIDVDRARQIARSMIVVRSAVAVTSTAARFTAELGVLVTPSDVRATLQAGVVALVSPARGSWFLAEVL